MLGVRISHLTPYVSYQNPENFLPSSGEGGLHHLAVQGCRQANPDETAKTDRPCFLAGTGVALGGAAAGRWCGVWGAVDAVLDVATGQNPG